MKKLFLSLYIIIVTISCMAQKPLWTNSLPKPSNDSFWYYREIGFGENYDEAYKNVKQKVYDAIRDHLGNEITVISIGNNDIIYKTIEGQTYKIPFHKICEWPKPYEKTDHWEFLFQIAEAYNEKLDFDIYTDCYVLDNSEKHKVDRNALLLALIPGGGWGELYKDQKWGWGVVGAEVLLAGGGLACYFIGQRQQQIKNDNLNNISVYDAADRTYNTVTELQPWLYRGAIGVHVLNLIIAYCIEDKCDKRINKSFTFVPTLMPSDKDLAWGIGINYKF